jgi:hypothetical protein
MLNNTHNKWLYLLLNCYNYYFLSYIYYCPKLYSHDCLRKGDQIYFFWGINIFFLCFLLSGILRGSTYKSLARPGRKQATATKLGIYSTQSSIHFLGRCSNFCKPLKKKKRTDICPSNQVSATGMTSVSDEEWRTFNYFFQSREYVVVRRGQIRRIVWVIKTLEAQVGQFLLGHTIDVTSMEIPS